MNDGYGFGVPRVLLSTYGDGPTLTSAAAASCLPTSHVNLTLPTGYWTIGKMWHLKMTGRLSSVITTPGTARFDLRMGAVVAFDTGAILLDSVAGHTTMPWVLDVLLTCRAIGPSTSTTLIGQGFWASEDILGTPASSPKGGLVAMVPWNSAPAVGAGFSNVTTQLVDIYFTQTAATGSMTVHQCIITELN